MRSEVILIGIFAVIVLYYMMAIAMDVSNTTSSCEAIVFEANETLTAAAHTVLLYPTPVLYNTTDCDYEISNYTYASGGFTLGENIAADTYYATYDYDTPATVWGLNLTWVAILVTIGVGLLLAGKAFKVI